MCTVVNKYKESYDVYIGRGSKWGNPYVIGADGSREEVIEKYRAYLYSEIQSGNVTRYDLIQLSGKKLGCFCKPQACHGDIIVKAFKWAMEGEG